MLTKRLDLSSAKIIVDGNSLSVWENSLLSDKLAARLPGTITENFAVSGQSTIAMLSDKSTITAAFNSNKKHNIVVALEGGNHIDGGNATALVAHNSYKEYALYIKGAGGIFVACSIFDRNRLPSTPAYVAARQRMRDFNELMRSQWPGYSNAFVDSARIQPAVFDNAENLEYWPDGVHYNPATYDRFAGYVAQAILKIII